MAGGSKASQLKGTGKPNSTKLFRRHSILKLKELNINLVNIYGPPNTLQQLFEETLEKCQEILEEETSKVKTIVALRDYNFPFIQWPAGRINTVECPNMHHL